MRSAASLSIAACFWAGVTFNTHPHTHTTTNTRAPNGSDRTSGVKPNGVYEIGVDACRRKLGQSRNGALRLLLRPITTGISRSLQVLCRGHQTSRQSSRGGKEDRPWLVHSSGRRCGTEFLIAHTRVILRSCARRISASDPLIQHQDKGRNVTQQVQITPVLTDCRHYFPALVRREEMIWLVGTLRMVGTSF